MCVYVCVCVCMCVRWVYFLLLFSRISLFLLFSVFIVMCMYLDNGSLCIVPSCGFIELLRALSFHCQTWEMPANILSKNSSTISIQRTTVNWQSQRRMGNAHDYNAFTCTQIISLRLMQQYDSSLLLLLLLLLLLSHFSRVRLCVTP